MSIGKHEIYVSDAAGAPVGDACFAGEVAPSQTGILEVCTGEGRYITLKLPGDNRQINLNEFQVFGEGNTCVATSVSSRGVAFGLAFDGNDESFLAMQCAVVIGSVEFPAGVTWKNNLLELPLLTTIEGDLYVGVIGTQHLLLSALTNITGDLTFEDTGTDYVSVSRLASVGGSVIMDNATDAQSFVADSLVAIGGTLELTGNENLLEVGFERLTSVGQGIKIQSNPKLHTVVLEHLLESKGQFLVDYNPSLLDLHRFDSLIEVDGDVIVTDNSKLFSIDFPLLSTVSGSFVVQANSVLLQVLVPQLDSVGDRFSVASNPAIVAGGINLCSTDSDPFTYALEIQIDLANSNTVMSFNFRMLLVVIPMFVSTNRWMKH